MQCVLESICHSITLTLLQLQLHQYRDSPHLKSVHLFNDLQEDKQQQDYALAFFRAAKNMYYRLFLKYFFFVLTLQFKWSLVFELTISAFVYSNIELMNAQLKTKYHDYASSIEIEFSFSTLNITNLIVITSDKIYVNSEEFTTLFSAFAGILSAFMVQIRLLYLNNCLRQGIGIDRDLGDDLAVMNGNGKVTIISFNYVVPTPIAFYHAFVVFCKQGIVINKEAGWISIGRKDREKQPPSRKEIVWRVSSTNSTTSSPERASYPPPSAPR